MCVVFFFLMIRRPPRVTRTDTLFPYTTLFRSDVRHRLGRSERFVLGLGGGQVAEIPAPESHACHEPGMANRMAAHSGSGDGALPDGRSEEHTSELQSLMRISYAVFCLQKKKKKKTIEYN